jgi:hypothetical protein
MGLLDNSFVQLVCVVIVCGIIVSIMDFLGIQMALYLSYLLWFIAISLFAIFLPRIKQSAF